MNSKNLHELKGLDTGDERPVEADDEDVQRILNGERIEVPNIYEQNSLEGEQEINELQSGESISGATGTDAATSYRLRKLKGYMFPGLFLRTLQITEASTLHLVRSPCTVHFCIVEQSQA